MTNSPFPRGYSPAPWSEERAKGTWLQGSHVPPGSLGAVGLTLGHSQEGASGSRQRPGPSQTWVPRLASLVTDLRPLGLGAAAGRGETSRRAACHSSPAQQAGGSGNKEGD